jgi:hypothetical protein
LGETKKKKKKKNEEEIKIGEAVLKEGMQELFEAVGKELGALLKSRVRKVEAA